MKKDLVRMASFLILAVTLSACGGIAPTPAVAGTGLASTTTVDTVSNLSSPTESGPTSSLTTPDPCSMEQVEAEVQNVHKHMREFDDASLLASNLPREQLNDAIANLQRIRREAEDEEIPACLINLKRYEVDHMNTVINTLVAFMGGTSRETLEQGISAARQQHDQYTLELARLLGLTVVPATPVADTPPAVTATP